MLLQCLFMVHYRAKYVKTIIIEIIFHSSWMYLNNELSSPLTRWSRGPLSNSVFNALLRYRHQGGWTITAPTLFVHANKADFWTHILLMVSSRGYPINAWGRVLKLNSFTELKVNFRWGCCTSLPLLTPDVRAVHLVLILTRMKVTFAAQSEC